MPIVGLIDLTISTNCSELMPLVQSDDVAIATSGSRWQCAPGELNGTSHGTVAAAVVMAVVVWLALDPERREAVTSAIGLSSPTSASKLAKPICDSPVNPNVAAPTDCIPQHLANLPPDPGEAGKLTIDGIDSDKDGMRDDVQRWIAQNWGHSPLAVKALTQWAQVKTDRSALRRQSRQRQKPASSLGLKQNARSSAISRLETTAMLEGRASDKVTNVSHKHTRALETVTRLRLHVRARIYPSPNYTTKEACGFDADALAAQTGEQTISSQLRAESIERTEREEREEREREKKEEGK